ncbi:MAG: sugar-transfer associated ATP-grasp domain-containing protein [Acidobacteriota bacterium]
MRICFLMEPPRSQTSVTYEILDQLKAGGAEVSVVTERSGLVDLENFKFDYDFYLFKSHSPMAESLAAAAHYRGCRLLNEYPATMKVRDKILTCLMLLQAGIPTPKTFVTDSIETLREIVRQMPIVVKPYRGRRGQGIEVCMNEEEFDQLIAQRESSESDEDEGGEDGTALGERLVFAQEFCEHEPYDYKAYAVGDYVHVIRRIFPARTKEEKLGTPVEDDPELTDLVRRCGQLFGLELYGVDLIKTNEGFSVIEVNCFPGYKGVPQGGERIARFILDRAEGR